MTVSIGLGPNFPLVVGWVGLGQSADGLGWIGSHKMDSCTTLSLGFRPAVTTTTTTTAAAATAE